MPEFGSTLPASVQRRAYECIAAWRQAPGSAIACPRCDAVGVTITDRSARPFAEWYQIECPACALNHAFQVPVTRPYSGD